MVGCLNVAGWRKLVLLLCSSAFLAWGLQALLRTLPSGLRPEGGVARADMAAYWTAGRLFLERGNAYDAVAVARMEGLPADAAGRALVMRNPPWTLPLVAPFGALPFRGAFFVWDAISLAGVLYALALLARVYGLGLPSRRGLAPLLFVPAYLFLLTAETTWLVLLGFALFLAWEERRPAAAGAALFLASLKFNICFLFWPVFLLWALERRRRRYLWGLLASVGGAMAAVLAWDPKVAGQYLGSLAATHVATQRFPNLVGAVRAAVGGAWPAIVLPGAGMVWAIAHYWRRRADWRWREQAPLLLLVSLLLAPYSFLFDELIAVVAILAAAAALRWRRHALQGAVFGGFLAAQALLLVLLTQGGDNRGWAYLWTPAAWLGLYLAAVQGTRARA